MMFWASTNGYRIFKEFARCHISKEKFGHRKSKANEKRTQNMISVRNKQTYIVFKM